MTPDFARGDDFVDCLSTETYFVGNLGSCKVPGAARPYGIEHSGFVVSPSLMNLSRFFGTVVTGDANPP